MSNGARFEIRYPGRRIEHRHSIPCLVGDHMEIKPRLLEDYCASPLLPIEHDLIVLSGAIAYADRLLRRRGASGWMRELELIVPVHEPDKWNDAATRRLLTDTLEFVTGDAWSFKFVDGANMPKLGQTSLDLKDGPFVIIPFSDGLDSFLQWKLLSVQEPEFVPLRIQTSTRAGSPSRNNLIDQTRGKRDQKLHVPVRTSVGSHPEPTYRTRTFLFYTMAAIAAAKTDAQSILIGESGVGSLGPSLVPYGNESPHRTTHPGFTSRLERFINGILGTKVTFEHRQIRQTKGEVLKAAHSLGIKGWENTRSCVRGARDRLDGHACGVCSGCLLRRQSLNSASVSAGLFFWNNLAAPNLNESRLDLRGRTSTENDEDILGHAVHSMTALAELAYLPTDARPFRQVAWELSQAMPHGLAPTASEIHRLVAAHAAEWSALRTISGDRGLLG